MKDANKHLALIDDLRTYGFRVVMDDFGRGYSSLNMLQDMNLDAIKIDMEFLRRNEDPERSRMILEMVLNLAKELDIHVASVYAGAWMYIVPGLLFCKTDAGQSVRENLFLT